MAEQDQWRPDPSHPDGAAIARLEQALARIASAAGRRQDELREAELTARAAQHEADLLLRAQAEAAAQAADAAEAEPAIRHEALQALASRLDGMIASLRAATGMDAPDGQEEHAWPR